MTRSTLGCLVVALVVASAAVAAEPRAGYRVVVHPDHRGDSIDRERLSRVFLKRITGWEDGTPVLPVDLHERSPIREVFSRDVHRRRPEAIKSFWQKMIFSGTATPPPEVDSDAEVLEYVRSRPGSIGYVSVAVPGERLSGVKVLQLVDERAAGAEGATSRARDPASARGT